jgi:exodeoxyribonuclease VII large subunit
MDAKIEAVIWKYAFNSLAFPPEEGMEVIVTGKITTYQNSSRYQIVIENIIPDGAGALMAMFEERKKKLAAEGLFDASRKKDLPFLPSVIGVITSPTGAVIRDILHRIQARYPTRVLLWPATVQGAQCADEIVVAIQGFHTLPIPSASNSYVIIPRPDVIIIARGGGSVEDLWGFNEEILVRAVSNSDIPVISAIGHETDTTLIDYVADVRAPTPSAAAEMAVPVRTQLVHSLTELAVRTDVAINRMRSTNISQYQAVSRRFLRQRFMLQHSKRYFDLLAQRFTQTVHTRTATMHADLSHIAAQLKSSLLHYKVQIAQENLVSLTKRFLSSYAPFFESKKKPLEAIEHHNLLASSLTNTLGKNRIKLDHNAVSLTRAMKDSLRTSDQQLHERSRLLTSLSHTATLERGFAVIRSESGKILPTAQAIQAQSLVSITCHDGSVQATPTKSNKMEKQIPRRKNIKSRIQAADSQGYLFQTFRDDTSDDT